MEDMTGTCSAAVYVSLVAEMVIETTSYIRSSLGYSHDRTVKTVFHLSCHSRLAITGRKYNGTLTAIEVAEMPWDYFHTPTHACDTDLFELWWNLYMRNLICIPRSRICGTRLINTADIGST
jgi:hypothetical protein